MHVIQQDRVALTLYSLIFLNFTVQVPVAIVLASTIEQNYYLCEIKATIRKFTMRILICTLEINNFGLKYNTYIQKL